MLISTCYGQLFLLLFWGICMFHDLRSMEIDIRVFFIAAALLLCLYLYFVRSGNALSIKELLYSVAPNLLLLLFSKISDEALGGGDVLFFLLLGLTVGLRRLLAIMLLSFGFAGVVSLFLVAAESFRGRSCRFRRLPFLPFTAPSVLLLLGKAGGLL